MSDRAVREAIQVLEDWLAGGTRALDADALAAWNRSFREALAAAEKGPGWAELVARGHTLATKVAACQWAVEAEREAVRQELAQQAQGDRALRGYGASTR